MTFTVTLSGAVRADDNALTGTDLESFLDQLAERLDHLDAEDIAIGAMRASGEFEVSVTIRARDVEDALRRGTELLRAAAATISAAPIIDWTTGSATRSERLGA